jgi:hypothetical protein
VTLPAALGCVNLGKANQKFPTAPTNQNCQKTGICPYTPWQAAPATPPFVVVEGLTARGSKYTITATIVAPTSAAFGVAVPYSIVSVTNNFNNDRYMFFTMDVPAFSLGETLSGSMTTTATPATQIDLFAPGVIFAACGDTSTLCSLKTATPTCVVRWCNLNLAGGKYVVAVTVRGGVDDAAWCRSNLTMPFRRAFSQQPRLARSRSPRRRSRSEPAAEAVRRLRAALRRAK